MMITRQRKQSVLQLVWLPVLAIGFVAYFGYHAFSGDFGIWARERLEAEAERLTAERDRLVGEREALERRVASVRPESLDPDVVDLHARQSLGMMRSDEVVIRLDAAQQ
jgi:cell division protein FtsB